MMARKRYAARCEALGGTAGDRYGAGLPDHVLEALRAIAGAARAEISPVVQEFVAAMKAQMDEALSDLMIKGEYFMEVDTTPLLKRVERMRELPGYSDMWSGSNPD
jgi:hypothetical protein